MPCFCVSLYHQSTVSVVFDSSRVFCTYMPSPHLCAIAVRRAHLAREPSLLQQHIILYSTPSQWIGMVIHLPYTSTTGILTASAVCRVDRLPKHNDDSTTSLAKQPLTIRVDDSNTKGAHDTRVG